MPSERQRRTFDAPSQQPVSGISGKTPQRIQVDIVLINSHALYGYLHAQGVICSKQGMVDERQPIVRSRTTVGCAAVKRGR